MKKIVSLVGIDYEVDPTVFDYIQYLEQQLFLKIGSMVIEVNTYMIGQVADVWDGFDSIPESKFPMGKGQYLQALGGDMDIHKRGFWVGALMQNTENNFVYVIEPYLYFHLLADSKKYSKFMSIASDMTNEFMDSLKKLKEVE